MKSTDI